MSGRKSMVAPSMINFENLEVPSIGTDARSPWIQNVAKLSLRLSFECTKMAPFTEGMIFILTLIPSTPHEHSKRVKGIMVEKEQDMLSVDRKNVRFCFKK